MSTLHEITGLDDSILQNKLKLEPRHRFDANKPDNLVFMSPTVLLNDNLLRSGGTEERGAKEFLGLVTKRILEEDDSTLFKVPEITSTHMGYGVKSSNKEGRRAVEQAEADYWMSKLTAAKTFDTEHINTEVQVPTLENDPEVFEESPDLISEESSGLEIPVKGSYLLFFSILLIYFGFKKSKHESRDAGNIGANKVSDFLIFWTLPFLLSFSNRKLSEIEHHCANNERDRDFTIPTPTVETTAEKVIKNACKSINESPNYVDTLLEVYRDLLGSEAIEKPYKLLAAGDGSPIILIPLQYQETKLPAELKHLGKRSTWSKLGKTTLLEVFLSKFVKNKELQRDIFCSMKKVGKLQGIEYGVILPDCKTYDVFIKEVEAKSKDYFTRFESYHTRGMVVPHCAVIQDDTTQTTVSISYLPDNPSSETVAALFHALGSQFVDHFTVAILYGTVLNTDEPQFLVGNIHPVETVDKLVKEDGKLCRSSRSKKHKNHVMRFLNGRGQFSKINFPQTYSRLEKVLKKLGTNSLEPRYEYDITVNCLYTNSSVPGKFRDNVLPGVCNSKEPENFPFRVINQNGCAIKFIAGSARKNRLSLFLALKDYAGSLRKTLGADKYSKILQQVVKYFTIAIVTAGLPKVYPRETLTEGQHMSSSINDGDESDEVEEQDDEDDENEDVVDCNDDAVSDNGKNETEDTGTRSDSGSNVETGNNQEQVTDKLLFDLSSKIIKEWEAVSIYLGFDHDEVEGIKDDRGKCNERERARKMLNQWKRSNGKEKGSNREVLATALREADLSALADFVLRYPT